MQLEDLSRQSAELARLDPAFGPILAAAGPCAIRPPSESYFAALVRAILYQQLAGRAAAAIHGRFLALFPGGLTPEAVLEAGEEALRGCGLSGAKTSSVRDLSARVVDGSVPLLGIEAYEDDEIVERLSLVRGIGRWTAEMFLIFQLRRLDVWPVDDFAVRKGWAILHGLPESPKPRLLMLEGERLRPLRTVAAWYCWRATDTILPAEQVG